ncbi:hypothetical protein K439DRAFT_1419659 [Ramaria rubella]|nr:hypothetical protein K439DRAFT_1419659 [Ramaria rubella]
MSLMTDTKSFHPDFESAGDFIIQSSDHVNFRIHQLFLEEASVVFETMLTLPQGDSSTTAAFLDLPENSVVISGLLHLIYPDPLPTFENFDAFSAVLFAAEKYDMRGALSTLRHVLFQKQYIYENPLRSYAIARHFGWKEVAHLASRLTLTFNIYDPEYLSVVAASGISATDLFALFAVHYRRVESVRRYLDQACFHEREQSGKPVREMPEAFTGYDLDIPERRDNSRGVQAAIR